MKRFMGIPASYGMVVGEAFLYTNNNFGEIPNYAIQNINIESEWNRFLTAQNSAREELRTLSTQIIGKEQSDIVTTHIMMLDDMDFYSQIKDLLEIRLENIEKIVWDFFIDMKESLLDSPDIYIRERASDISDIAQRLMQKLIPIKKISLTDLETDVILVCHELLPSDILGMNKNRVKGIVTETGSRTSHAAILAKAFAIPAVLGLSNITKEIHNGEKLFVDGGTGEVIVKPAEKFLIQLQGLSRNIYRTITNLDELKDLPAETLDGHRVSLKANIGLPEEVNYAIQYGADGIGLYRSEFLFMFSGKMPSEEEQYNAYKQVITAMGKLPVTIRTLDSGGDKYIPELQNQVEKNPLLGWRAIRASIACSKIFKMQLRALIRSSVHGNLQIMFPMISGIEELEQTLSILEEAKLECKEKNQPYSDFKVGTMIEIPSAAITADILADKSAFFSIGTNDLVQYTIAVDRENEKVNYLAEPFHPAILRLIKNIIDSAHRKNIKACMCGEFAGEIIAIPILLGMGLDEFSMTAISIPQVKKFIRSIEMKSCQSLVKRVSKSSSSQETIRLINEWIAKHIIKES